MPATTEHSEDRGDDARAVLDQLRREAEGCRACVLHVTRHQAVFASGPVGGRLLVIGEAPGAREDEAGVPFVGRSGQLLFALIEEICGLSREQCYVTNVVKCRPPENRDPKPDEVASCSRFLSGQLETVAPQVVLCVGNFAARSVLGTREGITSLRGRVHQVGGRATVATFHPAYALRGGAKVRMAMSEDLRLAAGLLTSR